VVGFGTGHSVAALARSVGAGGRVFGIDISEGMLEVATRRVTEEGVAGQAELSLGDARQLRFADNTFGAAFISPTNRESEQNQSTGRKVIHADQACRRDSS
jgi:demethylmenaquinone methyltransferase/2-methoxy-6-polyprenyl-1,4-benzoquinol methylase